jgi:nicotinamidase-related amidase
MDRAEAFEAALKLEPGRSALVVVDMQRAFLDPGEAMEVPAAREIVPQVRALLDLFRSKRLPVIFTEFTYSERGPSSSACSTQSIGGQRKALPEASACRPRPASKVRPTSTSSPSSPPNRTSSW